MTVPGGALRLANYAEVAAQQTQLDAVLANVIPLNPQTGTAYTLVADDAGSTVSMNSASANTVTVPLNASVAFSVGTGIVVEQYGAGQTTIAPADGVTIWSRGSLVKIVGQYGVVGLRKIGTDEWRLAGDLA